MKRLTFLFCSLLLQTLSVQAQKIYDVRDFGAQGDGVTFDTKAVNDAIERCSADGGGIVLFPSGYTFLCGTIRLKGEIEYRIEAGALLLGAPNGIGAYDFPEENPWEQYQDFGHSYYHNSLMWGENLQNVSFTGGGEINGGGISRSKTVPGDGNKAIAIKTSANITFEDISIVQGGWFAVILNGCRQVVFNRVTIRTPRDGIDLMSCSDVRIADCTIRSVRLEGDKEVGGDDAIGIKSDYALGRTIASENIRIERTMLSSGCNAIQFGSETVGDFRNIRVTDCIIDGAGKAGIGITSNDGAVIEDVVYRNILMKRVATPLFIYVSDRMRRPEPHPIGKIRRITIEHVAAFDCLSEIKNEAYTATISGCETSVIEDVHISNFSVIYKGGRPRRELILPENTPTQYAPRALGMRPASGFYIRHAKNIWLENVSIGFEQPDDRPAFVLDHVKGIRLSNPCVSSAADCDVELMAVEAYSQTGPQTLTTRLHP